MFSNVIPGGGEILFEVYDKVGSKFLGCNIISVDEIGHERSKFVPLKSRRMEIAEYVTGNIEVEVNFNCFLKN